MAIDVRAFRQTIGHYATGVAVVAFEVDGTVRAMTANSLTSLSLDPPLLLFCVGKHTKTGQTIHQASRFSINILADSQRDISTYFAGAWRTGPAPSFAFIDWDAGPQLEGSAASIGCEIHAIHDGGDHWIVVGRVVTLQLLLPSFRSRRALHTRHRDAFSPCWKRGRLLPRSPGWIVLRRSIVVSEVRAD